MVKREFSVAGEHRYDRSTTRRWIVSHLWRHKRFLATFLLPAVLTNVLASSIQIATGAAFNAVLSGDHQGTLGRIALTILAVVLTISVFDLTRGFSAEVLGKRFSRDAREELFLSLLGKSQKCIR
jgi:ATP-binding cassette subfamily B protein